MPSILLVSWNDSLYKTQIEEIPCKLYSSGSGSISSAKWTKIDSGIKND